MKAWLVALIGLGCLMASGCAHARFATMALEEENRRLEDMIFQQQAELEQARHELEICRGTSKGVPPAGSGPAVVAPPPGTVSPATPAPVKPGAPDLSRPSVDVELPSTPSTEVPETLRGTEAPRFQGTPQNSDSHKPGPSLELPDGLKGGPALEIPEPLPPEKEPAQPLPGPEADGGQSSRISPASAKVVELSLNDALTGGSQTDPARGDQGITLVLEPRDRTGRLIQAAAPVSVVVIDPALQGPQARVARWDFTAQQFGSCYRKGAWGEGYRLEMSWPAAPPLHENLQLFVRYLTADNRKVEAQCPIRVAVAGSNPHGRTANHRSPPTESNRVANGWQQRPAPIAPREPLHLSSRPSPPAAAVPSPAASEDPSRLTRPTWSPDRR